MRTGNGWAGSVQKKRRAHETHLGYKLRAACTIWILMLSSSSFFLQDNWHPVDKPRAVPYSGPTPSERAVFYDAAQAAGPVYLHGIALTIQFESPHPVLHRVGPWIASTVWTPRLQGRGAMGGP